jgi:hypothetical protein
VWNVDCLKGGVGAGGGGVGYRRVWGHGGRSGGGLWGRGIKIAGGGLGRQRRGGASGEYVHTLGGTT